MNKTYLLTALGVLGSPLFATDASADLFKCMACPAGYQCDGTNKTKCPYGTYSTGGASPCSKCPAGYYPTGTTTENTGCTPCLVGEYKIEGDYYCSGCPLGKVCPKRGTIEPLDPSRCKTKVVKTITSEENLVYSHNTCLKQFTNYSFYLDPGIYKITATGGQRKDSFSDECNEVTSSSGIIHINERSPVYYTFSYMSSQIHFCAQGASDSREAFAYAWHNTFCKANNLVSPSITVYELYDCK